ncbi:MAG: 2-hydroxychromene-2-carboxylate isomerase [Defluviicoccus sp.]
MPSITFWYEFASTYSYPAAFRVEAAAAAAGLTVQWRPFLLGPIFAALGWPTSPFNLQPAKGRYMWRDLERTCARLGLPFRRPEPFPQNGVLAARIAYALPDDGARARFSRAVYRAEFGAEFGAGLTISEPRVMADILAEAGFAADAIMVRAAAPEVRQALRQATAAAQALGLFGAPMLTTDDDEVFWGNDRIEEAVAWASTVR